MALALGASQGKPAKTTPPAGEDLFAARCAPCHGQKGVGGPGYKGPLTGNRSVEDLTKYVTASMPPGKGTPAPQAKAIAIYMSGAFYSPLAQAKNKPPRVEMARLTVKQFKNAVADLMGYSAPVAPDGPERGLRGEYFKSRDLDAKQRVVNRVDPQVRFDFGTDGPVPGQFDPHNFSAAWTGSVLAPDTGDYEFVVRTEQGCKLFVNGWDKPLIDAWVKSGNETEFRGTIPLLGGRAYMIRLEFSKATQGVNDDDKKKGKPAPRAYVELLWRRPKRVAETIPAYDLFPKDVPPVYVVDNPFPADDRSVGYERGVAVSKEWDDAVTAAALEVADAFAKRHPKKEDCAWFVERAFRRPLDPATKALYVDKQFEGRTPEAAAKRVVLMALLSPRFLYREVGPKDPWTVASNLSFGLWDTLPDDALRKAAGDGKLKTRADAEAQANRMAQDPRAWNKLRDFLLLWLRVDEIPDIVKNAKRFPEFDAAVAADLRTSLEFFLADNGWDYQKLMLSPEVVLNGRLSKLYGGGLPPDAPFQRVEDKDRAGVLTQPYLMARLAYSEGSDPIHRGVLVVRNVLGRVLAPPPAAFAPLAASVHPDFTTRERVALQTSPKMCAGCHGLINPLGFAFERYDALGRLRDKDGAKAVDSTGGYKGAKFADARDLAKYLAGSDESHAAFVEKLFQNLVRQPVRAYGPRTLPDLQASFEKGGYNVRNLMVAAVVAASGAP